MLPSPSTDELLMEIRRLASHPSCRRCGSGFERAFSVTHPVLEVRCSRRACDFLQRFSLPPLQKKIIYLDTCVISHLAKANRQLFADVAARLKAASYQNVIECVVSPTVREELELSSISDSAMSLALSFSSTRVHSAIHVWDAQIGRAFSRFLREDSPLFERRPPREDVFDQDVNRWPGEISLRSQFRPDESVLSRRREHKTVGVAELRRFIDCYVSERLSLDAIMQRETEGFCRVAGGDTYLTSRLNLAQQVRRCTRIQASNLVRDFFVSEHALRVTAGVVNGRVHAAIHRAARSLKPRLPQPGDFYDIEHVSTYLPYVDVFLTDAFMASALNQNPVRLGEEFAVRIQALRERDANDFIGYLDELTAASSTAVLSAALYDAVEAGGAVRDLLTRMRPEHSA